MVKEITGATPNSFLARLWRKILVNDGYITYINQYRNDYINNLIIASELSNTKVIINKTNLNNKINSENMTWNTGFLVINGTGTANGESIESGDFVLFNNDGERFEVESGDEGLEIFVLAGEPLNEPYVSYGPFVMNTEEEIKQAIDDYNNGLFGFLED